MLPFAPRHLVGSSCVFMKRLNCISTKGRTMMSKYFLPICYSRKLPVRLLLVFVLIPVSIYWISVVNSHLSTESISTTSPTDSMKPIVTSARILSATQNKVEQFGKGTDKVEAKPQNVPHFKRIVPNVKIVAPDLKTSVPILRNNNQAGHKAGKDVLVNAKDKDSAPVNKLNNTVVIATKKKETNDSVVNAPTNKALTDEQLEKYYFTPHKTKINPVKAKFIIDGKQICASKAEYLNLLILIPSLPTHTAMRDTIRSTYGSYVKQGFAIEENTVDVTVRLAFLVGKDNETNSDSIIRAESKIQGDIVYADFVEDYRNLTLKMLIGLKWVSQYCNDISFVLKVDEDVYVDVPRLVKELHKRPYGNNGTVYGFLHTHAPVYRDGKWALTKEEFPMSEYPTYAAGNSYVISGNVIPQMAKVAEYLPSFTIEDAFITGLVGKVLGVEKINVPGFTYWYDEGMNGCDFVHYNQITITKVTVESMYQYWNATSNYFEYCQGNNTHP